MPVELHPLLRWRMARGPRGRVGRHAAHRARAARRSSPGCSTRSRERGPLDRGRDRAPRRAAQADDWGWNWSRRQDRARVAVLDGEVTSARPRAASSGSTTCPSGCCRPRSSTRRRPTERRRARELLRVAARALGVATEADLPDYYRLPRRASPSRAVAELVEAGELRRSRSRAGRSRRTCTRGAALPRRIRPRALLVAVRPAGLGARPHRAAVRLPVPDRDLHAGRQAGARLLRAAVPARRRSWWRGSTSRPTARPAYCGCPESGQSLGIRPPRWPRRWRGA